MNQSFNLINIEPSSTSGRQIVSKTGIGLLIGVMISALIFIIVGFLGSIFQIVDGQTNPLLPFIMLLIAFVTTFIGTVIVAWFYSLFYGKKYYDSSKMFALWLLADVFVFLIFFPVYLVYYSDLSSLYYVLAFHILFSVFVIHSMIEFTSNPNYSASHLIGTMIWFISAVTLYAFVDKLVQDMAPENKNYFLMLMPSILAYTLIPLWHGIWEVIYYKFYESGSNFFYLPSLSEVTMDASELETTEVDDSETNVNIG